MNKNTTVLINKESKPELLAVAIETGADEVCPGSAVQYAPLFKT